MKRDFGFTVIELLVVIAMVAILSSIAMPSYLNWRSTAKLNDAVSLICGDLERAKTHAIRRNEFVAILFNADGYTIFVDDGSGGAVAENWSHETGTLVGMGPRWGCQMSALSPCLPDKGGAKGKMRGSKTCSRSGADLIERRSCSQRCRRSR